MYCRAWPTCTVISKALVKIGLRSWQKPNKGKCAGESPTQGCDLGHSSLLDEGYRDATKTMKKDATPASHCFQVQVPL